MTLPRIDKPTFEMLIPSQNKKVTFRPFLVKEEKILLIAQQSDNDRDIVRALSQILVNCVQDSDFKIEDLTIFDLEYMFLKLRAKSVNNIAAVNYQDLDDEKVREFKINLDEVEVKFDNSHNKNIKITDTVGIIMKYPSVFIAENVPDDSDPIKTLDYLVRSCIDSIYDEDTVYSARDYSPEELDEFIDGLDVNTYDKIRMFFESMPKMSYVIEYDNDLGNHRKIELTSLRDFFSWG